MDIVRSYEPNNDRTRVLCQVHNSHDGLTERRIRAYGAPAPPVWTGKLALAPEHIMTKPMGWKSPRRIFVNSMGDLFHESAPDEWIDQVFAVMAACPQHVFQVLTKRSARMKEYCSLPMRRTEYVWLGVSAEDQTRADERIPGLLATPAAVRFVSAEPLLGSINFDEHRGVDWIIVGGESGPGARTMNLAWTRSIVSQCRNAGVPVFVKQLGARYGRLDRKGGDMSEWPDDLRVREFPARTGWTQ